MKNEKQFSVGEINSNGSAKEKGIANGSYDNSTRRSFGQYIRGVPLTQYVDLYDLGFQRAVKSGSLRELPEDKEALTEDAKAMAKQEYRTPFDPEVNAHDKNRQDENNRDKIEREEIIDRRKFIVARVADRRDELADVTNETIKKPEKPATSLEVIFALLLAMTILPTLHDFVFVMPDEVISWMASLMASVLIGFGIVKMMLFDVESGEQPNAINRLGLISGLVIALALGFLRLSGAADYEEYIFTIGFTLLEIGSIVGLEMIIRSHRAAYRRWAEHQEKVSRMKARLESAHEELADCNKEEEEINRKIEHFNAHIELRKFQYEHSDEIEAAAIKATLDGYADGIAHNRGIIRRTQGDKI